ncbi:hypothetical protein [Hyalangium versicolor]|uniref:hypothetical protein n=1 Tax=Hyalangium versicolor TaxID=2861190 RepID=UPI001CCD1626|nr:hypothetical protein [Hyalangium versicolor]
MVNSLSRYGLLLALAAASLATSAHAQASQRERTALHPCVITGGKKADVSELEAICATSAVRETMNLVPSNEVRTFLEKEHGSCAKAKNRNACLGRLAAATQATRTLYITVNPFTPKSTRITGLVVDATGKKVEERPLELPRIANQPPRDVVRFAVSQLLDQMEVSKAPAPEILPMPMMPGSPVEPETPPVVAQPAPTQTSPAPAPSPIIIVKHEPSPGLEWKTPVGITAMAVGGAGLITSGVLLFLGNSDAKKFNDAYAGTTLPPSTDLEDLVDLRDSAKSKHKLAAISAGAGAAVAITGAILWLTDRPSSPKQTGKAGSARLTAGPSQVGVLVFLP